MLEAYAQANSPKCSHKLEKNVTRNTNSLKYHRMRSPGRPIMLAFECTLIHKHWKTNDNPCLDWAVGSAYEYTRMCLMCKGHDEWYAFSDGIQYNTHCMQYNNMDYMHYTREILRMGDHYIAVSCCVCGCTNGTYRSAGRFCYGGGAVRRQKTMAHAI